MENPTNSPTTDLSCSVRTSDNYEDTIFESFRITIDGESREFYRPSVEGLLELADGTVLDVEIIGRELTVNVNEQWRNDNDANPDYIPSTRHAEEHLPDDAHNSIKTRLEKRDVSFHDGPY